MPKPFGAMRMSTKSELLSGALFLVLALIARSAAASLPANLLRDTVAILSLVMLLGGIIVVVVGLWHAVTRPRQSHRDGLKIEA
jgi:hypothetical protein